MVLMRFPDVDEVTFTDTVQDPGVTPDSAGTVPPLNEKDVPPADAWTVPPQLLLTLTGLARESPGWTPIKLSVQDALMSGKTFGL
jgi:hypothetical protein